MKSLTVFSIAVTFLVPVLPATAQPLVNIVAFGRSANGNVGSGPNGVGNPGTFGINNTSFTYNPGEGGYAQAGGGALSASCDNGCGSDGEASTLHQLYIWGTLGEESGSVQFKDFSHATSNAHSASPDTSASNTSSDISNWGMDFQVSGPALLSYSYSIGARSTTYLDSVPGGSTSGAPLAHVEVSLTGPGGIIYNRAVESISGNNQWVQANHSATVCLQPGSYSMIIHVQNEADAMASGGNCNPGVEADIGETGQTQVDVQLSVSPVAAATITSQPGNAAVCTGGYASFSVGATGNNLGYQWNRGGTPLVNGASGSGSWISGANGPVLGISNIGSADAGSYACVVSGLCNSATSNAAMLSVATMGSADGNGDGVVNGRDVQSMVQSVIAGAGSCAYDMNGDGLVSIADVPGFVQRVLSGQ